VALGDGEPLILAIKDVTFSLLVVQQVSAHSLPHALASGCDKVRGKRKKPEPWVNFTLEQNQKLL